MLFSARTSPSAAFAGTTVDWGRTSYREAWKAQGEMVARRLAGEIGDTLIFTEHDPVFTIGLRSGAESHLVWPAEKREKESIEVIKTNRGGDITYHGPGQLVGYPIINLAPRPDLHAYLRFLEQVLIDSIETFDLEAARRNGMTGIWIGSRKIAAIGVAVKRWVSYHGFALNVNVNLEHFQGIVPCGIGATDGSVTSLQAELGREIDLTEMKRLVATKFWAALPGFLEGRKDSAKA